MVIAREHDLLPGVMWDWHTDLDFDDRLSRYGELADSLLQLVDQGLIELRRLLREDRYEIIEREHLGDVLAEATVWSYTERGWDHRDEGLAIVETPAGQRLSRTDRSGVPDPQKSNPFLGQPARIRTFAAVRARLRRFLRR